MKKIILIGLFVFSSLFLYCADYGVYLVGGDWGSIVSWCTSCFAPAGVFPGAADNANINGGTITVNADQGCINTTVNGGSLTVSAGQTLTLSGVFTHSGAADATLVNGVITVPTFNVSIGTVTVAATTGSVTISSAMTVSGGTVTINGTVTVNGDLTVSGGSITIASGATLIVTGTLTTSGTGAIDVNGTLDVRGITSASLGAGLINLDDNNARLIMNTTAISASTGFTLNGGASTYTVEYAHTGTVNTVSGLALHHLEVTGGAEIDFAQASLTLAGDLTITNGTFDVQNNTLSVNGTSTVEDGQLLKLGDTHTFSSANLTLNGTGTMEIGTGTATGTQWPTISGTTTLSITSTVDYNGGDGMIIDNTNTYGNLIINANAGTTTLAGDVTVDRTFTLEAGTLDIDVNTIDNDANDGVSDVFTLSGTSTLKLKNTFPVNYDSYIFNNSTVEYNSTANIQFIADHPYHNLTVDGVSSNTTRKHMTDFSSTGTGTFTIESGGYLYFNGTTDFPTFASYDMEDGYIYFAGGDYAISVDDFSVNKVYVYLSSSSNEILINNNITVLTNFNIVNGIVDVTASGGLLSNPSFAFSLSANGTLELGGGNPFPPVTLLSVSLHTSSIVDFYGENQDVGSIFSLARFGNLIIRNPTYTKTLVNNISIKTLLDVQAGTLATGAFSITGAGTEEIQVLSGATLDVGSSQFPTGFNTVDLQAGSTVEFTAAGDQTVNDDGGDDHVSFYNVYFEGSGTKKLTSGIDMQNGGTLDVGGDANVSGVTFDTDANDISLNTTLTLNVDAGNTFETSASDLFDASLVSESLSATSTFLYNGTTQAVEELTYGNLILDQAGVKTLQNNASPWANVTISNNATFDIGTFTLTGLFGSTLDINDDCRLALSGAANFPTGFQFYTFNTSSTIDYNLNGAQTIALQPYANLDITGGGSKTVDVGEVGVTGILDIEDGASLTTSLSGGNLLRFISTGDEATETARIDDLSDESGGTLIGDGFVCERNMNLTGPDVVGWNDWASPIEDFKLASWYYDGWPMTGVPGIRGSDYPSNPFCSVLTYNASTIGTPYVVYVDDEVVDKNDGWVRATGIQDAYQPGTGFRLYTGARDRELEDYGLPAQGQITINLNYVDDAEATDADEGWNFIGNPYMCPIDYTAIDFKLISDGTAAGAGTDYINNVWVYSNTQKGYYAFNANTGVGNGNYSVTEDFTVYTAGAANGIIPSHKAFWVKTLNNNVKMEINESDKYIAGTTYIKNSNALPKLRVQAQNLNNGFISSGVIVQLDDAQNTFENYDAAIFKALSASAPNLFFLSENGEQLSVDAVPSNVSVIPMQIEAGVSGDFELRFWDFNDIHTGACIMLEDKFTNEWFDLREEQSIVRTLSDTTTITRFNIHINPILNTELVANATCFGTNDGEVLVENLTENVIGLGLYDKDGVLVYEDMVSDNKIWSDLSPGIYTLREANTNIGCPSAVKTVEVFEPAEVIASFEKSADEVDLATDIGEIQFTSTSTGGEEYIWYFSDNDEFSFEANVIHAYRIPGLHDVSLLVHNGNYDCARVFEDQVLVKSTVGISEEVLDEGLVNATVVDGQAKLNMNFDNPTDVTVLLFDMAGKELGIWNFKQVGEAIEYIELPNPKAIYLLKVQATNKKKTFRLF